MDPGTALPPWLLAGQPNRPGYRVGGTRARKTFLERTLAAGAGLMRSTDAGSVGQAGSAGRAGGAGRAGAFWRLDPRVKVFGLAVLLIAVALVRSPLVLTAVTVLVAGVAWLVGLPIRLFAGRVLLVVPGTAALLASPSALSVITPGQAVVPLGTVAGSHLAVTVQGLLGVATVTSRVAASVAIVALVTMTTPWQRLLWGLGALGVPKIFLMVVSMAYRYLFLLLGVGMEMFEARKVRTVAGTSHDRRARRFVAASLGTLIGRATQLSEEVYQAMVARGYRGDAVGLHRHRIGPAEAVAVLAVLAAAAAVVGSDLVV